MKDKQGELRTSYFFAIIHIKEGQVYYGEQRKVWEPVGGKFINFTFFFLGVIYLS